MGLFILYRLIFVIILSICGIMILKKYIRITMKIRTLYAIFIFVIFNLLILFPVENLFIVFNSIQSTIDYYSGGEIIHSDCQEKSCMVWVEEFGKLSRRILERSDNGYKLPDTFNEIKIQEKRISGGGTFEVIEVKSVKEKYVSGIFFGDSDKVSIVDSQGNELESFLVSKDNDIYIIRFYGDISKYTSDYSIIISY